MAKVFENNYKKEFDAYKEQFKEIVYSKCIQDLLSGFTEKPRTVNGRGQYKDVLYWYKYDIKEDLKTHLKEDYKTVKAIHIMPYCITKEDVEKKDLVLSNRNKPFRDQNSDYVDYDGKDATKGFNFHKYTDIKKPRFQVVLVNEGTSPAGPGCREYVDPKCFLETVEDRMKCIKTDWYFPKIEKEEKMYDGYSASDLEEFLEKKEAYKELLKKDLKEQLEKAFEKIFKPEFYACAIKRVYTS